MKKEKDFQWIAYVIIIIPVVFLVCFFGYLGSHYEHSVSDGDALQIEITDHYLHLKGLMMNDSMNWNKIQTVELIAKQPSGSRKGGGIITDDYLEGDLYNNEYGMTRTYAYKDVGIFLVIKDDHMIYIVNSSDEEKTKDIYEEIISNLIN